MKPTSMFIAIIAVSLALSGIITSVFFTAPTESSTGLVIDNLVVDEEIENTSLNETDINKTGKKKLNDP